MRKTSKQSIKPKIFFFITIRGNFKRKQKILKARRPEEDRASGVVVWDAEITNQDDVTVAVYDILTLVERADD